MGVKLGNGNWAVKEDKLLAYNDKSGKFFNKEFDFTRGSSATYVAKDGLIKTAGIQPNSVLNSDFSQEGAELVTNGDFSDGFNGYQFLGASNAGTPIYSVSNNKVVFDMNGGYDVGLTQSVTGLTAGKSYKLSADIEVLEPFTNQNGDAINQLFAMNGASHTSIVNNKLTSTFSPGSSSTTLSIRTAGAGARYGKYSLTNISLVEVAQNWVAAQSENQNRIKINDDGLNYTSGATYGAVFQQVNLNIGSTYIVKFNISSLSGNMDFLITDGNQRLNPIVGLNKHTFVATLSSCNIGYSPNNDIGASVVSNLVTLQEIQVDTPRIDFSDSPKGALLLEPSSTNIITNSETFSGWFLNGNISTTQVQQLNPSGQSGCLLLSGATDINWGGSNNAFQRGVNNINSNSSYTFSVFVKSIGSTTFTTTIRNNNTGTLDRTVHDIDGNWKRVSVTASTNSTQSLIGIVLGGTNGDVLLWGAQLEQKPVATSYIPTYETTATRLTESCNNSGSAQDFNSEEGVLYAEIVALANVTNSRFLGISNGSNTDKVILGFENSSTNYKILAETKSGGSTTSYMLYDLGAVTPTFIKCALKYKANDFALWINGTEVLTDTSGSAPIGLNELAFDKGDNGNDFYGKVRNLRVYTEALTDAELQELTS